MSLFPRDHLHHWLALSLNAETAGEFAPDTTKVWDALREAGALFFGEIVKQTGLLPSKVEQGLADLAAQGCATSDSFEGLRALLLPRDKRTPFAGTGRKRHHKSVTSVEFAGRWSVLLMKSPTEREAAVEVFARALLHRYGVVFRRLLEREAFMVSWYELGRVYRRLEARGEIRGGHFVSGVSDEC